MSNTKSILYIINHMDWFWSHRLPLAVGAKKDGWDVIVAGHGAASDTKLEEYGFKGVDLPAGDKGFAPFTALKLVWSVFKLLKRTRPTRVHVITLKYAFLAGLAVRLAGKTKIIHTVAGLGYLFSGEDTKARVLRTLIAPLLKLALNHDDAQVIVQNPDDQALLIKRGFVTPTRCHLIRGSGVDTDTFPYVEEPATDEPLVIMPTRLIHDKGISVFIEVARILKKQGVKARFQIAGGVSLHNPLAITEEEMKAMTADGTAEWLGKVSDMQDLYARSSLVLYPSWYGEGIPKVLLEAASTGRAIITTDHPGCREAVENDVNGLLVPVKNAQNTAESVKKLLKNREKRIKMGRNSRKKAENEFNVQKIVQETLKTYNI